MSKVGLRVLAERENVVDTSALGPGRARGGAGVLAGRRADRGPQAVLRAHPPARGGAGPPRGLLLDPDRGLQGARRPGGAGPLLPRPARPAGRDRLGARPQPLLHQHLAVVQARPALRRARPQRRDQHDRPAAPGGADGGGAAPPGRLGLPGPLPHHRGADLPPGPDARRGDGAGASADRGRDQGPAAATCAASTCTCARRSGRSRRAPWR